MIVYNPDGSCQYMRWRGSIVPSALGRAIPGVILTFIYHFTWDKLEFTYDLTNVDTTAWAMSTSVLGFLLVFRAQIAYSRYWEGVTLAEQACAVWLNGYSNLIAFRNMRPEKEEEVARLFHLVSRLMSLLVTFSMTEISQLNPKDFPHLSLDSLDPERLQWLESNPARQHIVLQWIQHVVVEGCRRDVISVAPPIVSRVFQELSMGIVNFTEAKKLTKIPLPFEFAQCIWVMLMIFSYICVPAAGAMVMTCPKAMMYTLLILFPFWSIYLMAVEIEMPFGADPNDLPLEDMCTAFNTRIIALLDSEARTAPTLLEDVQIFQLSERCAWSTDGFELRRSSSFCGRRPSVAGVGSQASLASSSPCQRMVSDVQGWLAGVLQGSRSLRPIGHHYTQESARKQPGQSEQQQHLQQQQQQEQSGQPRIEQQLDTAPQEQHRHVREPASSISEISGRLEVARASAEIGAPTFQEGLHCAGALGSHAGASEVVEAAGYVELHGRRGDSARGRGGTRGEEAEADAASGVVLQQRPDQSSGRPSSCCIIGLAPDDDDDCVGSAVV